MPQHRHQGQSARGNHPLFTLSDHHRITDEGNTQQPSLASALRNSRDTPINQNNEYNSDSDSDALNNSPAFLEEHIRWSTANNTNIIPRVLLSKRTPISQLSTAFFSEHPNHDIEDNIYEKIQKYGLMNCMNQILADRGLADETNHKWDMHQSINKKRRFSEIARNKFSFIDDVHSSIAINKLASVGSSFLKSGSTFYLSADREIELMMKFTNVSSDNQSISGLFQSGCASIPFTGKNVDFLNCDLRCQETGKFSIESSIFDNLLRHHLIGNEGNTSWSFSASGKQLYLMNIYGYLLYKYEQSGKRPLLDRHEIKYPQKTKFPNTSIFHKVEDICGNTSTTFKFLSKWFELPPFNEFLNTPSPPTPPYGKRRCTNNPENMLGCNSCINSILKSYILLELSINIEDLLYCQSSSQKGKLTPLPIIPDLIFKKRRCMRETLRREERNKLQKDFQGMKRNKHDREDYHHGFSGDIETSEEIDAVIENQITENYYQRHIFEDMPYEFDGDDTSSNDEFDTDSFEPERSSGRSQRMESLLFQRDNRRSRIICRMGPISAVKLYKNCKNKPLTLKLLVSISRITGEVYIVPGNLDRNNWSSEENCGTLFADHETFKEVYTRTLGDAQFGKVNWPLEMQKTSPKGISQQIQKIMLLLMIAHPALLDTSWKDKLEESRIASMKGKSKGDNLLKNPRKNKKHSNKKYKRMLSHEDDELEDSYTAYYNDKVKLGFDPCKILRLKPYQDRCPKRSTKGELNPIGSTFSFALA